MFCRKLSWTSLLLLGTLPTDDETDEDDRIAKDDVVVDFWNSDNSNAGKSRVYCLRIIIVE